MSQEQRANTPSAQLILFNDAALRKENARESDAFSLSAKLQPISDAVLSRGTDTPFSVMFSGGWGTGKTSAMRWLDQHLVEEGKKKGAVRIDTCWFYPWKYQDREDVWKGLIAEVILATIDFENVDKEKLLKAVKQFVKFCGASFAGVVSSLKAKADFNLMGHKVGVDAEFEKAIKGVTDAYRDHVTPQEAYYNAFEHTLEDWIRTSYREDSRLVVFIDDLDRCLPAIALQVLEAIKLYLNIPKLIVIVGVDRQVIDAIVTKHYHDVLGDKFEGKARQYLDKMFQVEVPISPRDEMVTEFIKARVQRAALWQRISEDHRTILEGVITEIADINPRSVLRALNTAIVGAGSTTPPLKVAQLVQVSFVSAILQKLPETEFGIVHDLCLRNSGREFFQRWSEVVCSSSNESPKYLSEKEIESLRDGTVKFVSMAPPPDSAPAEASLLQSLARENGGYAKLMGIRALGLLMRIPFTKDPIVEAAAFPTAADSSGTADDDGTDNIKKVIAGSLRIGVDQVSLDTIKELDLTNSDIRDDDLAALAKLPSLTSLRLDHTNITSEGITHIARLTNLRVLSLIDTGISDTDLERIHDLIHLEELDLSATSVSGKGLEWLTKMNNLRALYLTGTNVEWIGSATTEHLSGLRSLSLAHTGVTDRTLDNIEGLSGLTVLDIRNTNTTSSRIAELRGRLPHCRIITELYDNLPRTS